nr:transposase [Intestinibacillus sp. Marseille-P6563]
MWVGENESAKFWTTVLHGLKNRGVENIYVIFLVHCLCRVIFSSIRCGKTTIMHLRRYFILKHQ